ncbi:hypothetical protein A2U01_0063798, partial [Trifolium medium]|nr:hypothetical protein [Trifolium medium]
MTEAAWWDSEVCTGGEARKTCVEQNGSPALGSRAQPLLNGRREAAA